MGLVYGWEGYYFTCIWGLQKHWYTTYSADCRAWGKFPLPQGWNKRVSTSVIYDAEFREIKDQNDMQHEPEAQEENQDSVNGGQKFPISGGIKFPS